jgi:hypothetical protein
MWAGRGAQHTRGVDLSVIGVQSASFLLTGASITESEDFEKKSWGNCYRRLFVTGSYRVWTWVKIGRERRVNERVTTNKVDCCLQTQKHSCMGQRPCKRDDQDFLLPCCGIFSRNEGRRWVGRVITVRAFPRDTDHISTSWCGMKCWYTAELQGTWEETPGEEKTSSWRSRRAEPGTGVRSSPGKGWEFSQRKALYVEKGKQQVQSSSESLKQMKKSEIIGGGQRQQPLAVTMGHRKCSQNTRASVIWIYESLLKWQPHPIL